MKIHRLAALVCVSLAAAGAAQESGGKIVLDIPVRQSVSPEDSADHVTIVVRGMKKSRSGAT